MTYAAPPFPTGLAPGKSTPSALGLQQTLKAARFWPATVSFANTYGPTTQGSVAHFYNEIGSKAIGPLGWTTLHEMAYGDEPAADYTRVNWAPGIVVNQRTSIMLKAAAPWVGPIFLSQGSYHPGFSASGGTHDGGGVVDINVNGLGNNWPLMVWSLRRVGFAAWHRTPAEGFPYHIHAVAIGDEQMSPAAHAQVVDYFAGRNGLANHHADTFNARNYPTWALKYK